LSLKQVYYFTTYLNKDLSSIALAQEQIYLVYRNNYFFSISYPEWNCLGGVLCQTLFWLKSSVQVYLDLLINIQASLLFMACSQQLQIYRVFYCALLEANARERPHPH